MSETQKKRIQSEAMKDLGLQPLNNTAFEKNRHNNRNGKKQGNQGKRNFDSNNNNKNRKEGGNSEVKRGRHQSGRNGKFAKKTKGIHKNNK